MSILKIITFNWRSIIDKNEFENVASELDDIIDEWRERADGSLVYQRVINISSLPLLKNNDDEIGVYTTLNAMRNVEGQSNLYLEEV